MKKLTFIISALLACLFSYAQTLSEKQILTDTKDSVFIKSPAIIFDKVGNYCITITKKGVSYFVKNTDTIGGFPSINGTYGTSGEITYTSSYSDQESKPYYYKNAKGTNVYGMAIGKKESYITSHTKENLAMTTTLKDSVYYFKNGKRVAQNHINNVDKFYIKNDDWCAFSENGNSIHFIEKDSLYHLYVNEKQIDSSKFRYTQLAINNSGFYIYARGYKPEPKMGKYDYMFFIHSKDSLLGYTRTVWEYELKNNNAYHYTGDDNGPSYIAINNILHKNIKYASNIIHINKNIYLYKFGENQETKINVCSKIFTYDFNEALFPTLDTNKNFAFYGVKDYYLYKYVNGRKIEKPISKYNIRATPLYISPIGESLHYFKTDDSIYIYRDETLLFKPISKKTNFQTLPHKEILSNDFIRGKTENGNSLFYMEIDSLGYMVFNGAFSKPMIPVKEKTYDDTKMIGQIIEGEINDNGFYAIQKTGTSKYTININNRVTKELENVDAIIKGQSFFDGKELIFYGIKNRSFYQFKLTL